MNWMKSFPWTKVFGFVGSLFANAWAFLMLAVFPLYAPNQYFNLGNHKFQFFLWCSVICLLPALILLGLRMLLEKTERNMIGAMDWAMLGYLAVQIISFLCSKYKQDAWIGADGWYMGLRTQLLLGAAYFCISRARMMGKLQAAGWAIGFGTSALLGVLHRFRIDPLGMYEGISEKYYLEFLSTLGQATWFSSYLCVGIAVGTAAYFLAKSGWMRVLAGIFCVLGFGALVTQNSDSAFLAIAVLVAGSFVFGCQTMERMEHFLEWLILLLGSFKIVGLLQQIFPEQALRLDSISVFLSQSLFTWIALLAIVLLYLVFLGIRLKNEEQVRIPWAAKLVKMAAVIPAVAAGGYVLMLWLNTAGWLGGQIRHQYLLFDDAWGNYRGIIWKVTLQLFGKMNLLQKVVGTGPDCFWKICYENPELSGQVQFYFGSNQLLTNAHNEFLNVLICGGLLGVLAFLGVFLTALRNFAKEDVWMLAASLAVLTYSAHNFFCYQQVCCTPFLFLLLGMAQNRIRYQKTGNHK